jgi:hypothetical protein
MNRGIVSLGNLYDCDRSSANLIIDQVYELFAVQPTSFFVSGNRFPTSRMTANRFKQKIEQYGFSEIINLDILYESSVRNIDVYLSIFFFQEKSIINLGYVDTHELAVKSEKIWQLLNRYIELYYGFYHSTKYDPILYATGAYTSKFSVLESFINKQQIEKERFWRMNYSKTKEGIIRDIYPINLLNNRQLKNHIVGDMSLNDYVVAKTIGKLLPFGNDLKIWHLDDSDMVKAEELKSMCNENTILNSPKWKFR